MIVDLADEMDIPPQYISDSVPMPKRDEAQPVDAPAAVTAPEIVAPEIDAPESQVETSEFQADENKPTQGMIAEAKKGLEWRREYGRGGTNVGVARARDIANGKNLPDETVKRMHSFFSRHEVNKQAEGFSPGEPGFPSAGRIAWALWGGDAGQTWAADKVKGIAAREAAAKIERMTLERDAHGRLRAFGIPQPTEFVLPTPNLGESENDFIGRCMGSDTMIAEFPDPEQRSAVCYTQLRESK
jgi:hypothetical protein